jgi:hypothetical protein
MDLQKVRHICVFDQYSWIIGTVLARHRVRDNLLVTTQSEVEALEKLARDAFDGFESD